MTIEEKAIQFIKKNKKLLIDTFANSANYECSAKPVTIFMAGAPGVGKTEFSKSFGEVLFKRSAESRYVRIDADEIREIIPMYNGKNSHKVHAAACIGVDKLFDYIQKKKLDAILDGTFADYRISERNIQRTLNRNREAIIMYLYQDPFIAWEFTQKRAKIERRTVPKEVFVNAFFKSKENVNKIKEKFGEKINLNLAIKDFQNRTEKTEFNINNVDGYLKIKYTMGSLNKLLK